MSGPRAGKKEGQYSSPFGSGRLGSPSRNLNDACVPSQKGLFEECPQRHKVTRLRISYVKPSGCCTGIPPLTHNALLMRSRGSSSKPRPGSKCGSTGALSSFHAERRPAGQWLASRIVSSAASLSLLFGQIPDAALCVAEAGERTIFLIIGQRDFGSVDLFRILGSGRVEAVRAGSQSACSCEPSQ